MKFAGCFNSTKTSYMSKNLISHVMTPLRANILAYTS